MNAKHHTPQRTRLGKLLAAACAALLLSGMLPAQADLPAGIPSESPLPVITDLITIPIDLGELGFDDEPDFSAVHTVLGYCPTPGQVEYTARLLVTAATSPSLAMTVKYVQLEGKGGPGSLSATSWPAGQSYADTIEITAPLPPSGLAGMTLTASIYDEAMEVVLNTVGTEILLLPDCTEISAVLDGVGEQLGDVAGFLDDSQDVIEDALGDLTLDDLLAQVPDQPVVSMYCLPVLSSGPAPADAPPALSIGSTGCGPPPDCVPPIGLSSNPGFCMAQYVLYVGKVSCGFKVAFSETTVLEEYCPEGGPDLHVISAAIETLSGSSPVVEAALIQAGLKANDARDDSYATQQTKADSLADAGSRALRTAEGQGKWQLTLAPAALLDAATGDASPVGSYAAAVAIPVEFGDSGEVSQPSKYAGPGTHVLVDDPPPSPAEIMAWMALCVGASVAGGKMVEAGATAGAGGPWAAAAGAIIMVGGAALFLFGMYACAKLAELTADRGHHKSQGNYTNNWGGAAGGETRWDGTVLNVPGIVEITTFIKTSAGVTVPHPFGNVDDNDWEEKRREYQEMKDQHKVAAWEAHNAFMNIQGSGEAQINLRLPFVQDTMSYAWGEGMAFIAATPYGDLFFSTTLGQLILACPAACSDSALLTIGSPGTAEFTVGHDTVTAVFAGIPGEGYVSIGGVILKGLTLDAQNNGNLSSHNASGGPIGPLIDGV